MKVKIELTASASLLDAINALSKAFSGQSAPAPAMTPTIPMIPVIKKEAKPAAEKDEPTADQKPASSNVTVEQLRSIVRAKAQAGKREELKGLLSEFGSESVTTLPVEKYADFKAKVEAL